MSTIWKVILSLAVVVPLAAYVAGSMSTAAGDDQRRDPLVLESVGASASTGGATEPSATAMTSTTPSARPTRSTRPTPSPTRRPTSRPSRADDGPRVIQPTPRDARDDDDDRDDRDDDDDDDDDSDDDDDDDDDD